MRREYRTGRTASARSLSPYAQLDLDTAGRPYNDAMRSGGLRVKRFILLAAALLCHALLTFSAARAGSQIPALPEGARTRWIVKDTQEIVAYVTFDPARLEADRPRALRFITVDELASGGVSWATDYLKGNPTHGRWGVSFVEILRAGTFAIDGRAPNWPAHGAVALWCARVAPSDPAADLGPGRPLLVLGFWLPDRAYVAYMRGKGHAATYANVTLEADGAGRWQGSVDAEGLTVSARCVPNGPITGGTGAAGAQALFPSLAFATRDVLRVAFAGHREQECGDGSSWQLRGTHPLAGGDLLSPSVRQFGYELVGGAYAR